MSVYDSKANYHPVSQLAGNLTNGSYMLPGNGYYSVTGTAPRIRFDHSQAINDPKYLHTQSYRIDPLDSLTTIKQSTSLTKYYNHDPPVENVRDRYIFVPKFFPRDENTLMFDPELEQFKQLAENPYEYSMRQLPKLPDVDNHVLPQRDMNNEVYQLYKPKYPYDLMTLRETDKYNRSTDGIYNSSNPNFVSITTVVPRI